MEKKQKRPTRQSFIHGAMILTLGMVVVKVVGVFFKIPLPNILTQEGNGYFGYAYEFYNPVYSLATAGFPIAIARMVSVSYAKGQFNDVRKIKAVSIRIFLVVGIIGSLIMLFGAGLFCRFTDQPYAYTPILVLSPLVLFSCLSSIYRGYYEGLRDMYPTAVSEIIESIVKLTVGLAGAVAMVALCSSEYQNSGTVLGAVIESAEQAASLAYSYGAAGAIFGVTFGSVCATAYLYLRDKKRGDGITLQELASAPGADTGKSIVKQLLRLAIPIAIGSVAMSSAGLVDTFLLTTRLNHIVATAPEVLQAMYGQLFAEGGSLDTLTAAFFGCYTSALTVYMLVPTIAQAIGTSALPNLATIWAKGDKPQMRESMESILRISALVTIPAGLGLAALSNPIAEALYGMGATSEIIANSMRILGVAAIGAALSTPISSMLQAVGRVDIPVKVLLVGMVIKIAANYILCGIPQVNILGAGTGTLLCYFFTSVVELLYLRKITGVSIRFGATFGKPTLAALACAFTGFGVYMAGSALFGADSRGRVIMILAAALICAVFVYCAVILLIKGLHEDDVRMLPKGERIERFMKRRGWL